MAQTKVTGREVSDKSIFYVDIDLTTAPLHPTLVASDRLLLVDPTDGEIKTSTVANLLTLLDTRYYQGSPALTDGIFDGTGLLYVPYATQPAYGSTPASGVFYSGAYGPNGVGLLHYSGIFKSYALKGNFVFAADDYVAMGAQQSWLYKYGLFNTANDEMIAMIGDDGGDLYYYYADGMLEYNSNLDSFTLGTTNLFTNLNADYLDGLHGSQYRPITCSTTTAAATVAKVVTISNYSLLAGDILAVTFVLGNSANAITINVNNTGAKNVRSNGANVNTVSLTLAAGSVVLLYYDGTYFNLIGSQRNVDTDSVESYTIRYNYFTPMSGASGMPAYKIYGITPAGIAEPLTTTAGTGTTKVINTVTFCLSKGLFHYALTSNTAANTRLSAAYSHTMLSFTTFNYTHNGIASPTTFAPVYLVANSFDGDNFTLDSSSYTAFLTQTLPTTADGKFYIYLGTLYSGANNLLLEQNHPVYYFKAGALRLYDTNYNSATPNASDKQVLFMDGTAVVGSDYFTFDQYTGDLNIGIYAQASGGNSVALSTNSVAAVEGSIAIGYGADSEGLYSLCIGTNSSTFNDYAIAIGVGSFAGANNSIAIGRGASTDNDGDITLGSPTYNNVTKIYGSLLFPEYAGSGSQILTVDNTGQVLLGGSATQYWSLNSTVLSPVNNTYHLSVGENIIYSGLNQLKKEGPSMWFRSYRSSGGETYLNSWATVGTILFYPYNDGGYASPAAGIHAVAPTIHSKDDIPADLVFTTRGSTDSSAQTRMVIESAGNISMRGSMSVKSRYITTANQTLGNESFIYINAGATSLYLVSAVTAVDRLYYVANIAGSSVTLRVASGDSLNGTLNGTFSIKAQGLTIIQQGAGLLSTGWYAYELR
jgi:hypothetical protein